jgi:hypothetical protein
MKSMQEAGYTGAPGQRPSPVLPWQCGDESRAVHACACPKRPGIIPKPRTQLLQHVSLPIHFTAPTKPAPPSCNKSIMLLAASQA